MTVIEKTYIFNKNLPELYHHTKSDLSSNTEIFNCAFLCVTITPEILFLY